MAEANGHLPELSPTSPVSNEIQKNMVIFRGVSFCRLLILQEAHFQMIQKVDVVPTNPIDLSLRDGIIATCISERKRVSRMANDTITGH